MKTFLTLLTLVISGVGCGSAANPAYCIDDDTCGGGVCDLETRACGPAECSTDDDCGGGSCLAGRCLECVVDSDCPDARPSCSAGSCQLCEPGPSGDALCAERDPGAPLCQPLGTCAECDDDADCGGAVCDAGQCRACRDDGECESEVCASSGECISPDAVVYVEADAELDPQCGSAEAPCPSLIEGLARTSDTRPWLRVRAGGYVSPGLEVTGARGISFASGSQLTTAGPRAIEVHPGADLEIRGMSLESLGHGLWCEDARVRMTRSWLSVAEVAISGLDCDLEVGETEVAGANIGFYAEGGRAALTRTVIRDARDGIVFVSAIAATLDNNLWIENGSATGTFGVFVETTEGARMRFNTITGNHASANYIHCGGADVDALGNLVWNDAPPLLQGRACHFRNSNVRGGVTGTGNTDTMPSFAGPGNYHLSEGSPLADRIAQTEVATDFEGKPRIRGLGADVGAFESQ